MARGSGGRKAASPRVLIAGAGIGGLATALSLHAKGFDDLLILEAAPSIDPLGVGLNILPNAVRVLSEVGVFETIGAKAVHTSELRYYNCHGNLIWSEPRGVAAGYLTPQLSVHRGDLQGALLDAVLARMGADVLLTDARVTAVHSAPDRVSVEVSRADGSTATHSGDVLVGADGIQSAVRAALCPGEGAPPGNGLVMWRGTSWAPPFLDGRTMIVSGDDVRRIVLYPIRCDGDRRQVMINWVAAQPAPEGVVPAGGAVSDLSRFFSSFDAWSFEWLDIRALIASAAEAHEFPMLDREPLDTWTRGRVTLLGDAAHAMYPMGSNGATQAVVDGWSLANAFAGHDSITEALLAYETERRPITTELQIKNRHMGPESVISVAHERAPQGFTDVNDVFEAGELAAIAERYAVAGRFDVRSVNGAGSKTTTRQG